MTTDERIATLESRIDHLQEAHRIVVGQLAQAHIDQWQGRIDDLELQVRLGTADATDRIAVLTTELNTRWRQARAQLASASATTTEVTDTIRTGLESAYKDVRDAVVESRKQLT
ncbi:MAG: hypothetical protein JWP74_554 [Marmoricola sp.]|nr:hypothetical protein [Marmoricola sp.]